MIEFEVQGQVVVRGATERSRLATANAVLYELPWGCERRLFLQCPWTQVTGP